MNEDTRNTVLAVGLSAMILIGWMALEPFLFPPPPEPTISETIPDTGQPSTESGVPSAPVGSQGVPGVAGGVTGSEGAGIPAGPVSRQQAIASVPRVTIDTGRISGSINLEGARFDDLILKDYDETLDEGSPNVELLRPRGGFRPYFAQFGWSPGDGSVQTPTGSTVWEASAETLSPGNPVTLSWTNDQGITFEQIIAVDENYMFQVDQRVTNGSGANISVAPYGRVYRSGTPDITGLFVLHEGLIGVLNGSLEEIDYSDLADVEGGVESFESTGGWIGITDKYWLVALVPEQASPVTASFQYTLSGFDRSDEHHTNFLYGVSGVADGQTVSHTSNLFAGAKETILLDEYSESLGIANFDLAIDFGWFYFLTKPGFYVLHWLFELLGNFGVAILAVTVIVKIIFFPLANKAYESMSKMKLVQPKIMELREKCGDDRQKLQEGMMKIYKEEKVNPLLGCLPILVQIPVFFALYKVLIVSIEMRHAPFFGWIQDLSAPDPTGILEVFGFVPWDVPALLVFLNIGIWPIIMGFTMWFQQKLNPPPADQMQARIFAILPIFFTFILGGFAAGLVIYWAWNNTLSILQQYIIMRRMGVAIGGGKVDDTKT